MNSFVNTLEIVFCTCFDNVELMNPAPALFEGFGYSNSHAPVELRMVVEVPRTSIITRSARLFDFGRADYEGLIDELGRTDWNAVLSPHDLNNRIDNFYMRLFAMFE